jgi:folate-binding protein YgfZ
VASPAAQGKDEAVPIYFDATRSIVRFAGPDARKLLNDTLTCRFDDTLKGIGRWFALLSPQGKVQVEGLVTQTEEAFWTEVWSHQVDEFVRLMKRYRLRAKVDVDVDKDLAVLWSPNGEMPDDLPLLTYRDERAASMGKRHVIRWTADVPAHFPSANNGVYDTARIAAGLAEIGANFDPDEVFPHDIGMDLLGGVDFKKGCFIGQEVVSRMQHRGTARRRPVVVSDLPDDAPDVPILIGEREAGTVGQVIGGTGVAIIRLDRVSDPTKATAKGKPVTLRLPAWAAYGFGETGSAE